MPIIRGTHSKPGQIKAETDPLEPQPASIDQPNHSFKYLTIDASTDTSDAWLPTDNPADVIDNLKKLADEMFEESDTDAANSSIPPVYTYWGQFIDHDITAGTDRPSDSALANVDPGFNTLTTDILNSDFTPQSPGDVVQRIVNLRLPHLDLDSVYAGEKGPQEFGVPEERIYQPDNIRLEVGENLVGSASDPNNGPDRIPNPHLDGGQPPRRDLPRHDDLSPRVGDSRNDENLIVAQFHTAFLRFHNQVVDVVETNSTIKDHEIFHRHDTFSVARQIVRWHYQWLVVEDFLRTLTKDGFNADGTPNDNSIVSKILASESGFFEPDQEFMPLEFSVAAFRFGHTMIRLNYDHNMNFGRGDAPLEERASLERLFQFTGKGGFLGTSTTNLPANWIIDWSWFTEKPTSPHKDRSARKIDTNLAFQLKDLVNELPVPGNEVATAINKNLAKRNLLRGYLLSIPTGEHVAKHLGLHPLDTNELAPSNKPKIADMLQSELFRGRTPLWYYILREAEIQADSNSLGDVGSHLVAGTLIGLLKADADSYLNKGWDPSHETAMKLSDGSEIDGIMDFFRFARVAGEPSVGQAQQAAPGV